MEDSEPTFSTEPSSSAMRARAFTWVFTRSCQSTAVFAEAVMVFPLRAMLTAGITRETSPARCPAVCGAAQMSAGIAIRSESITASPKADGDFVFIEGSPGRTSCIYRSYCRALRLSTPNGMPFAHSLHALVSTPQESRSTAELKDCRSHVVVLFPAAGELFDRGEDAAQQFPGRDGPMRIAKFLQPLDSKLFTVAVKGVGNSIRAEKHRIAGLQWQGQCFVARRRKQSRRNPADFQEAAAFRAKVQGAGHARAGDLQFMTAGIKQGVLDCRMPARHAANHEPPVQRGKHIVR